MDALKDATWIKHLHTSTLVERFTYRSFRIVAVAIPSTATHHHEQYRYRMFFFDGTGASPVMAVNLESDLLDGWRLTIQAGAARRIVESFDTVPAYETFKALALPLVDAETVYSKSCRRKTRPRPES